VAVAAASLALALELEPAALRDARLLVNDLIRRNVTRDVKGGVFYDELPGLTLYAERVHDGRWSRVLISDRTDPDAPMLALAQEGRLEPAGGGDDLKLVLERGEAHREELRSEEYLAAAFERATITLGVGSALRAQNRIVGSSFELTPAQVLRRSRERAAAGEVAEARRWATFLHRRIAGPLSVLAFALFAVPIAATRRGGRAFAYAATLLGVVAYYAVMRFGEGLSQDGRVAPWLGPQLGNLLFAGVGLALLALLGHRGPEAVR
jgi:lipopolysaccharide export system permease protein